MLTVGCEEIFLGARTTSESLGVESRDIHSSIVAVLAYNSPYYRAMALKTLAVDSWNTGYVGTRMSTRVCVCVCCESNVECPYFDYVRRDCKYSSGVLLYEEQCILNGFYSMCIF